MSLQIGVQLGNYRLTRLLGQGGFADVYLADHLYLKRQVAIKVLRTFLDERQRTNFLLEAQRLVDLHHPHIVRMVDFAIEGTTPFLVMEYAPNGTLRSRHPEGSRIPLATVVAYTRDIASALQHLHQQRLIHRDVKPENILLGRSDELLLSDLGIAGIAHATHSLEFQGQLGTVAYMAPEQIRGKPRPASDQYALGIMVYEWLCGERPFAGDLHETAIQHVMAPPPSIRARVPDLPETIDEVIGRALAKDPTQRFESVEKFADALQEIADTSARAQQAINSRMVRRHTSVLSSRIKLVSPDKLDEEKSANKAQQVLSMNQLWGNLERIGSPDSIVPEEEPQTTKQVDNPKTGVTSTQDGGSTKQERARWTSGRVFRIAAVMLLIIGLGTGVGWWLEPHPSINISSPYHQGTTPVGAAGVTLQVQGTHFASNASLPINLDGNVIPGSQATYSKTDGTLLAMLAITPNWPLGRHMLAIGNSTDLFKEAGVPIEIVAPGDDHTPGPAGAPPDDFSGTIDVTIQFQNEPQITFPLTIKKPDQPGGRVCQNIDDGKPLSNDIMVGNQNYHQTRLISCNGLYKGGKLTYIETTVSEKQVSPTGVICSNDHPVVLTDLEGTFKDSITISGTASSAATFLVCNDNSTLVGNAAIGTWTGYVQGPG